MLLNCQVGMAELSKVIALCEYEARLCSGPFFVRTKGRIPTAPSADASFKFSFISEFGFRHLRQGTDRGCCISAVERCGDCRRPHTCKCRTPHLFAIGCSFSLSQGLASGNLSHDCTCSIFNLICGRLRNTTGQTASLHLLIC
jgi:hypothetical protein